VLRRVRAAPGVDAVRGSNCGRGSWGMVVTLWPFCLYGVLPLLYMCAAGTRETITLVDRWVDAAGAPEQSLLVVA
jgi:hypothetical protein